MPSSIPSALNGESSASWSIITAAAVIIAVSSVTAGGEMITFGFSGTFLGASDPDGILDTEVEDGMPFSGWYTFDSETPDSSPSPGGGSYQGPANQFSIQVGEVLIQTPSNVRIDVHDIPEVDRYTSVWPPFESNGLMFPESSFVLEDYDGIVFDSDALPLVPPPIGEFERRSLTLIGLQGDSVVSLQGVVTELTLVPEPASAMMLLVGTWSLLHRETIKGKRGIKG
jgi:hypothetical protein